VSCLYETQPRGFHSCAFLFLIKTIPSKQPVATAATATPELTIAEGASETDAEGLGLAAAGSGDTVGLGLGRVGRGYGGRGRLGWGKGPAISALETETSGLMLSIRVNAATNLFIKDESSNYTDEHRRALYW
jgi:hypothetical protein